jgi:hypothetical protein
MRSQNAMLSPKEQSTLGLIAHGITESRHLRGRDIKRLLHLQLAVVGDDGEVHLTNAGSQRFKELHRQADA